MKNFTSKLFKSFRETRLNKRQTSAHLYKTCTESQNTNALFALEDARSPKRIWNTAQYRTSILASQSLAMVSSPYSRISFSPSYTKAPLEKAKKFKLSASDRVTPDMRVGNALVPSGSGHEMVG